jgi:hypothetical protein
MNKLRAFIYLDFETVKPYFTIRTLLIFGAVALFLSAVNGSVAMSLGIGLMLGTLFTAYPFAICEQCNLDALYITLAVNRRTVVAGRYLFVLLMNAACIVFSFVFATIGVFGARAFGIFQNGGLGSIWSIVFLTGALILVQMIQLPIFFKLGYTRAKFLSILPFMLIMAAFAAFASLARDTSIIADFSDTLGKLFGSESLTAAILAAFLILIIFCSYRASMSVYSKREF